MRISDWSSDVCSSDLKPGRDLDDMLQRRAGSGKGCLEVGDRLAGLDDDVPEDDRAVLAARQLARDEPQIAAAPDLGERRALGGGIFGGHVFPFSPVDRSAMRRVPPRPCDRKSVVAGKSVAVRLGLGGWPHIKKQ